MCVFLQGFTAQELREREDRDVALYGEEEEEAGRDAPPDLPDLDRGFCNLDAMPKAEQPAQMKTQLFDFQRQGLLWMQQRENEGGGILADEMGLGKTLQTIGLIVSNPAPKEMRRKFIFQTLVLCPLSCLQQWCDEFKTHAPSLNVLKYYGPTARNKPLHSLHAYDVLVTTYGTVANGMFMMSDTKEAQVDPDEILRKIYFWRIVLDEAHLIRNVSTKYHKACLLLKGRRRWCLSGTPLQNRTTDVGALLRFVGHSEALDNWRSFKSMCDNVDKGNPLALSNLHGILKPLLLRRTKRTTINGVKIFNIKPPLMLSNEVPFDVARNEDRLYRAVSDRYNRAFQELDQQGLVGKNHASIFTYILRLRQLCLHPLLFLFGRLRNYKPDGKNYLLKNPKKLVVSELMPFYHILLDFVENGNQMDGANGLNVENVKMVRFVLNTDVAVQDCCICMEEIIFDSRRTDQEQRPLRTKCNHLYHEGCISEWLDDHDTCPMCRAELDLSKLTTVRLLDTLPEEATLPRSVEAFLNAIDPSFGAMYFPSLRAAGFDMPVFLPGLQATDLQDMRVPPHDAVRIMDAVERLKNPNAGADAEKGKEEEEEKDSMDDGKAFFFDVEENGVPPSTKLTLLVHTLQDTCSKEPDAKILVFSQFTAFLDLLEECLSRTESLQQAYVRLDGSMTSAERTTSIIQFSTDPTKRIFLLSLKVASLGLNLTSANRVFLVDPWWNPSVEQQAIDRVVRFGQKRDVTVLRLFISNSIEDRLRSIQEKKQRIMDDVLNEDSANGLNLKRVTASSVKMLRQLFARDPQAMRNNNARNGCSNNNNNVARRNI